MEAGHGGAAGRFDRLEEIALIYAFALKAAEGSLQDRPHGEAGLARGDRASAAPFFERRPAEVAAKL
jgi:hypothetical protein